MVKLYLFTIQKQRVKLTDVCQGLSSNFQSAAFNLRVVSLSFSLPTSLYLALSALWFSCLYCDEWLHFQTYFVLQFFFFLRMKLQSVQLCRNKIDLADVKREECASW